MQFKLHTPFAWLLLLVAVACASGDLRAYQATPLDELEQQAFEAASDFCQESIVQVEAFGGMEFVNKQATVSGPSTGTILTSDGWIASSTSYFKGQPASITVVLSNGTRKPAKLVARDYSREIAILKIEPDTPLRAAVPSDPKEWKIGQWTIALGKTFDSRVASRSVGILSAQGRVFDKAIQTDCKISPQNYGGPLVDLRGRVMGILTLLNPAIATEGEIEQWYDSGIGFAIPIQDVLSRLPKLKLGEDIHPGKVGIRAKGRDEFQEGISLVGVGPGSPAAMAGLKPGDKIVRAGRGIAELRPVATYMQFRHVLYPIDAEQNLAIEVDRQGVLKQFEMTLVKELPEYREPYLGIATFREADFTERVMFVAKDSPASLAGIVEGDVVTKFFGQSFDKEKGLEQSLWFVDYRKPVSLAVRNAAGEEREVTVATTPRPDSDVAVPSIAYPSKSDSSAPENTIQQLPMGDVKNRAFAIVPNTYRSGIPHGLLVVFADAGQQDTKVWADQWEKFASEHRWIVVVIQSADEKGWTIEELELAARVRAFAMNNFSIDARRIGVAGFSSAAVLAVITALQNPADYNALWVSGGNLSPRIRFSPPEPGQALRVFVNGKQEGVKRFAKMAKDSGLNVIDSPDDWETKSTAGQMNPVQARVQRWLAFLIVF